MKHNNTGFHLLAITAIAALMKGGQYAIIGRFLPLVIALIPTAVVLVLFFWPKPQVLLLGKVWAWMLIGWGVARITIALIAKLTLSITENHVHEQSGLLGTCLSLCALAIGIYLLRKGFRYLPEKESTIA